ncbi:hypothetical protein Adt_02035 [Abeliophyllum distichum]|uniref:Uncharacterized protein n=1 Tax=Abeliophyllum distichum TaxID=126358 RepID=A0ABD1VUT1_9LAMI
MEGVMVLGIWQLAEGYLTTRKPDLNVPSVYGIASPLPRCELSRENTEVLRSIYEADSKSRSYNFILNRQRCLVELGLVASKAEMDQGRRPRSTLAKLAKQRPRTLMPGSADDTSQRKVIEDLSQGGEQGGCRSPEAYRSLERTLAVNTAGEVVLEGPSKSTPAPESGSGGPYDSKRRLRGADRGSGREDS